MNGFHGPARDVHRTRDLAQRLLMDLPERWRHTIGVARQADTVADTVGSRSDGDVLLAAAWLHDIGYAAALHDSGFHPIDGADTCRPLGGRAGSSTWSRTTPQRGASPDPEASPTALTATVNQYHRRLRY